MIHKVGKPIQVTKSSQLFPPFVIAAGPRKSSALLGDGATFGSGEVGVEGEEKENKRKVLRKSQRIQFGTGDTKLQACNFSRTSKREVQNKGEQWNIFFLHKVLSRYINIKENSFLPTSQSCQLLLDFVAQKNLACQTANSNKKCQNLACQKELKYSGFFFVVAMKIACLATLPAICNTKVKRNRLSLSLSPSFNPICFLPDIREIDSRKKKFHFVLSHWTEGVEFFFCRKLIHKRISLQPTYVYVCCTFHTCLLLPVPLPFIFLLLYLRKEELPLLLLLLLLVEWTSSVRSTSLLLLPLLRFSAVARSTTLLSSRQDRRTDRRWIVNFWPPHPHFYEQGLPEKARAAVAAAAAAATSHARKISASLDGKISLPTAFCNKRIFSCSTICQFFFQRFPNSFFLPTSLAFNWSKDSWRGIKISFSAS